MSKLILLRHGQSVWNKSNIFTGWIDIPLSKEGIEEAVEAGKVLSDCNVDVIYVSTLVRAEMTAFIVMAQSSLKKIPYKSHRQEEVHGHWYQMGIAESSLLIPVYEAWELNERMYGSLQAKNKRETMDEHGEEQVQLWRRSYDVCPPNGESLEQTAQRSIPFFKDKIIGDLEKGKDVFVCAHGNSLRSILMHMENLSKEQVLKLEVPTGIPMIYEYGGGAFRKAVKA